jgi:hypothetical protein
LVAQWRACGRPRGLNEFKRFSQIPFDICMLIM